MAISWAFTRGVPQGAEILLDGRLTGCGAVTRWTWSSSYWR